MKIKTITRTFRWAGEFDDLVNKAMEEGWHLVKREVIPGSPNDYAQVYAELVQLDEPEAPPEPQPLDPFDALHVVREFCDAQEKCGTCPLFGWCCQLRNGGDPTDWTLPEKEAPEE